ncbi:APC family permease [Pseudarthrobacter sp. O4]|uniref:APC family permease n=1 Tax=Pseudarthrobacter sp. O4 TaxID=3418417 RepID=UPI003CEF9BC7
MPNYSSGPEAAPPARAASSIQPQQIKLKRVLGLPSLVFFGLVYMVPLTIFTTYGVVSASTGGRASLAYIITLAAMIFTAKSYASMVKVFPVAGSSYSYASKTFGPNIGFLAGWSLLLDYMLLPMVSYLVIGIYLNILFPAVPAWIFVVACILLVTVLNVVGISSVATASNLIVLVQFVFIAVFVVIAVGFVATGNHSVNLGAPFTGDGGANVTFSTLMAGAAVLCLSFLGFDAISTMAEEAKNPKKDIPRAIIIVTVGAGLLFLVLAYISQLVFPGTGFNDPVSAASEVMLKAGGDFLNIFFIAAYVAGATGSAITSQASVSRILYSMGRDGMLPRRIFGTLSARFKTPIIPIMLVSVISVLGVNADVNLLFSIVSFGALIAFSIVNLSVMKRYLWDEKRRSGKDVFLYGVLPGIGFLLTLWIWTSLAPNALTIGVIWLAAGLVYLLILTKGLRRKAPQVEFSETL